MPNLPLPERASLEYLKKLAKSRLQDLRRADPQAKLATALLAVARDHGFSSWRSLKSEIEQRQTKGFAVFFEACTQGDVEALRSLLTNDPSLVHLRRADRFGATGLHPAAGRGHLDAVRLLLEHGADPNIREAGDNTYPLHWAAARGHLETARALLDSGGDVNGFGDVHELDVIGWATFYRPPDENPQAVVSLLVERGARHHIFSAICMGDLDLIQQLVEQNPEALDRRMSHFEQGQTPLHLAMSRHRYDILDLLIELGADVEAVDKKGQTAMALATLHGDQAAITRLQAAGAVQPKRVEISNLRERMAQLSGSIKKGVPMISVPDIAKTVDWYTSIGFEEIGRYEDDGLVNFGMLSFGNAELMLNIHGKQGTHDVALWFYTDQVDNLYQLLKSGQAEFVEDINDTFYGAREFGIRDPNGYTLYFIQPEAPR